jgi:hypothetical protein
MLSKISQWLKGVISGKTEVVEQPVVVAPVPETKSAESVQAPAPKAKAKPAAKKAPAKKTAGVKVKEVVVKPNFEAGSLDSLSKTELVELARKKNIKISPRMGKAAIIKKMMS